MFANFIKNPPSPYCKGLIAELLVISVLEEQGFILLHHRKKIQDVEIDLVLRSKNNAKHILLIEVKSHSNQNDFIHLKWSYKQRLKFQKVLKYLTSKYPYQDVTGVFALASTTRVEFYFLDQV